MFEYFYNEILRRTIISFGTLFNGISVEQKNESDQTVSNIRVPLAYGPTQKFLARLEQQPDLNKGVAITLPRMSFEFTGLTYDPTRKVTTTQQFTVADPNDGTETKKAFMPVPYNMQFELAIMCKLNDDALQIVEQILPYFQPAYNVTVELVESIKEKRDIPVILENITMQDDYEGDFTQRRVLLYTLRFTAKTYLFGPVQSATKDIIRKATLGYLTGTDTTNTTRNVSYTVVPRAIKSYSPSAETTLLTNDLDLTTTVFAIDNIGTIAASDYIVIGSEEMLVRSVSGSEVTVTRGKDGTTIASHLKGEEVKKITAADTPYIEDGDNFGFDGSTF